MPEKHESPFWLVTYHLCDIVLLNKWKISGNKGPFRRMNNSIRLRSLFMDWREWDTIFVTICFCFRIRAVFMTFLIYKLCILFF